MPESVIWNHVIASGTGKAVWMPQRQFVCWKQGNLEACLNLDYIQKVEITTIEAGVEVRIWMSEWDQAIFVDGDNAERFVHWWRNKDGVYYL